MTGSKENLSMETPRDDLMTNYPVQVVGAAILDCASDPARLLVACRSYPESLAGLWEFPGGKLELEEDAEAGLIREIREELGAGLEIAEEILGPHPQGWPLNPKMAMKVFTGTVDRDPQAGEDHQELRWMDLSYPQAILALPWIPADIPIVARLLEQIGRPERDNLE